MRLSTRRLSAGRSPTATISWGTWRQPGGYYVVRAVHSGKAMSVNAEEKPHGAATVQWATPTARNTSSGGLVQKDNEYFALQNPEKLAVDA
ncbi:RICIN domain-containing protein [Streptomyces sp. NPDC001500]